LNLKYDCPLSSFAFNCNLRHYSPVLTQMMNALQIIAVNQPCMTLKARLFELLLVGLGRKCSKCPSTH